MQARETAELIEIERQITKPYAQLSCWATWRTEPDPEGKKHDYRTAFQHDRDRIIHSRAFRRLKHKTQVFIPYTSDHQRTRLTHTIEVMQIGRTVARSLGLNEDLTEAVALSHDLGHTPFGHTGERTLDRITSGKTRLDGVPRDLAARGGGFKHNLQSLRIVDVLESRYPHPGLNFSDQTREGILKHTSWRRWQDYPGLIKDGLNLDRRHPHFEGQVVAVADEIAQQAHDLEDGLRAGIINLDQVLHLELIKRIAAKNRILLDKKIDKYTKQNTVIRSLIHVLVVDLINNSAGRLEAWCRRRDVNTHEDFFDKQALISNCVSFSEKTKSLFKELEQFVLNEVIRSRTVTLNDESGRHLIRELFRLYYSDPQTLPPYMLESYRSEMRIEHLHRLARTTSEEGVENEIKSNYHGRTEFLRLICDYIAGMSNTYAIREYEKWVMPFHG